MSLKNGSFICLRIHLICASDLRHSSIVIPLNEPMTDLEFFISQEGNRGMTEMQIPSFDKIELEQTQLGQKAGSFRRAVVVS